MSPSCRARGCRITKIFANATLTLSVLCAACSFDYGSLQGGNPGVGGGSGLGGTMDSSGTTSSGGSYSTSGTVLEGGSFSSGGIYSTGGTISKGGSNNSGGIYSAGGTTPKGGSQSSGGITTSLSGGATVVSAGGATVVKSGGVTVVNSGGVSSAGGVTTVGGSTSVGPTGNTVTFASGKAVGAMVGWGWVALGSADTISDPTCGPSKAFITAAAQCAAFNWSSTTALCITGSIPALGTPPDYTGNWGVSVGVNATDTTPSGGLGQSFTSITITVSGTPDIGLRATVHRKGDPDATSFCYALTSGTAIPLTSFTTSCYTTASPGTAITAADVPNIDKVSVQVSSGTAAITVASLCITGIAFQ